MAISLDHEKAKQILFEEAESARNVQRKGTVESWRSRVERLGELCPHGKSATVVAALGTAILAKATDDRVDVYSILDRGESEYSYSARSLADNVWAKNRALLDIDLGANGANPLNNTPFIGKTRIDEISGVRNREGWDFFIECMEALKSIPSSTVAREALQGFIVARSRSVIREIDVDPEAGDNIPQSKLIAAIDRYVAESSEGGRRAQACAAAILDAAFGVDRVWVGVINDPDRVAPLDVSVRGEGGQFEIAFEVKDKPIEGSNIASSVEKTVGNHEVRNIGVIAVSKQQRQTCFDDEIAWAARRGVKVTVFLDWREFYHAAKCFSATNVTVFEGEVFRSTLKRSAALGVDLDGLESFKKIAD